MKKYTNKFFSFVLILSMIFNAVIPSFAAERDVDVNIYDNYNVVTYEDTEYGTISYIQNDDSIQMYALWDILDIAMAGYSWSKLLKEPSWGNFGWAVLDTAALLPLLPSSAYVREGGKVFLKSDDFIKFAQTTNGAKAIKSAMKSYNYSRIEEGA